MDRRFLNTFIIYQIYKDRATPLASEDTPVRLPLHKLEDEFFSPEEFDVVIFYKWLGQPNLLICFYALNNVSEASTCEDPPSFIFKNFRYANPSG